MTKYYKGLLTALFVTLVLTLAAGRASCAEPAVKAEKNGASSDPTKEVVLKIGKTEFTRAHYNNAVASVMPQMSLHSSMSHEKINKIKASALLRLVNSEIFYEAAEKDKIEAQKKEIDDEITALKSRLGKGQTIESVLKNSNMTMAELREQLRKNIINVKFREKKQKEFAKASAALVTDKYMKDYYNKNTEKYRLPEQIRLRAILIKADPSGGPAAWSASLKKARDIVAMGRGDKKTAPKNFAALAKKYSELPDAQNGGDMGWVHRGEPLEEIDTVAAKMKIGDISDPITTIYGYYVVKLEGVKPSIQMKYADINKEKLKAELQEKEHNRLNDEWFKGLKNATKIEYIAKDVKELMTPAPKKDAKAEKDNKAETPNAAPDAKKDASGKGK